MMTRRGLTIMLAAFAVVLIGGVAVAAITDMLPGQEDSVDPAPLSATDANDVDGAEPEDLEKKDVPPRDPAKDDREEPAGEKPENPTTVAPSEDEPAKEPEPDDPKADEPGKEEPPADGEKDTTPPEFVILRPEDGAHVDDEVVTVSGEVEPGATVTFARKYEANVTKDGAWSIALRLERGKNVLSLYATDEAGNTSSDSVTVYLDRDEDHDFTAHQKWEVVDGAPAANKYYGTAAPGASVSIVSERGGAEQRVQADRSGHWEAYVEFPKAPCNEWFAVVVKTDGAHKAFEMKWACKGDHTFSAHQKWEMVDGTPAANKYYGTGVPGTHVWIVSKDGGAEQKVRVGDNGEWDAYVTFPKAPCNRWFDVVVEGEGGRNAFEMKWVCPDDSGDIEFTAHQQYGSCGEEVPYDVFWGTEDPGTKIRVESKYGSATTKANDRGEWEVRVEFPNAPEGKTFEVEITSSDGGRKVFTFTRTSGVGEH